MVGFNERKLKVLEFVRDSEPITSEMLSNGLHMEIHSARMCLLRYHKQGLLYRKTFFGDLWKTYRISPKGFKRIQWLKYTLRKV